MGVGTVSKIGSCNFSTDATIDFSFSQLQDYSMSPGLEEVLEHGGGNPEPTFLSIIATKPSMSVTTTEIEKAVTNITANGMLVGSDATAGQSKTIDLFLAELQDRGKRQTTHFKGTVNKAYCHLGEISASQGQKATASVTIVPIWDGTNSPITTSTGQTNPATVAATEMFTLGPISVQSARLTGVQSTTVNFGITAIVLPDSGDVHPGFSAMDLFIPEITISTNDMTLENTYGGTGVASTSAILIYWKALQNINSAYADASSEHLKLTIPSGQAHIRWDSGSGSQGGNNTGNLIIKPIGGSSDMFTFAANTAITGV